MHVRLRGALVVVAALSAPALAGPGEGEAPAPTEPTTTTAPSEPSTSGTSTPPTSPGAPPADHTDPAEPRFTISPFGYLRLQYLMVQNDPNVAFVGRDDGFELQNARLGVRGALGARVKVVVAIDGAVDERAQVNTPAGKLKVGLRDAYADVALPAELTARAGFFETLVDPNLEPDTVREFVDRPIESRGMRATEGYQTEGLTPGRSLGAALRKAPEGEPAGPRVGFEFAIQNGADEFASNNDNDLPAVSLSALVQLPHQGFVVASGRFNRRTTGALPFRTDEQDVQATAGARFLAGPVIIGGGVAFTNTSFPTTSGPTQTAFGGHAQLAIRIEGKNPIAIGYRFGIIDPSSLLLTDRVMEHTAGAVMAVPAYRMRVQLQATHVVEQAARTLSNDRIQLAAEVTL